MQPAKQCRGTRQRPVAPLQQHKPHTSLQQTDRPSTAVLMCKEAPAAVASQHNASCCSATTRDGVTPLVTALEGRALLGGSCNAARCRAPGRVQRIALPEAGLPQARLGAPHQAALTLQLLPSYSSALLTVIPPKPHKNPWARIPIGCYNLRVVEPPFKHNTQKTSQPQCWVSKQQHPVSYAQVLLLRHSRRGLLLSRTHIDVKEQLRRHWLCARPDGRCSGRGCEPIHTLTLDALKGERVVADELRAAERRRRQHFAFAGDDRIRCWCLVVQCLQCPVLTEYGALRHRPAPPAGTRQVVGLRCCWFGLVDGCKQEARGVRQLGQVEHATRDVLAVCCSLQGHLQHTAGWHSSAQQGTLLCARSVHTVTRASMRVVQASCQPAGDC